MSRQRYEAAVRIGKQNELIIHRAIQAIGTSKDSNKKLHGIYNKYRPLLQKADNAEDQRTLLITMQNEVVNFVTPIVNELALEAHQQILNMLELYEEMPESITEPETLLFAVIGTVNDQFDAIMRLLITGLATTEFLFGGDSRLGLLSPGHISRNISYLMNSAFNAYQIKNPDVYYKQAIATLDARTTACCNGVNLQVREFDKDFTLEQLPYYSSSQAWSPFHDWCRTSIILVHADDVSYAEGGTDA